jgi:hypothetical protein
MKRFVWLFLLGLSLCFVSCGGSVSYTGSDGNVYLTVEKDSDTYDTTYAIMDSDLPSGMVFGYASRVYPGTYDYWYNVCNTYSFLGTYTYYVDAYSTNKYYPYSISTTYDPEAVAKAAFYDTTSKDPYGLYGPFCWHSTFTLTNNKGTFLENGADRYYTLVLGWGGTPNISYRGTALSAKSLSVEGEKTVKVFENGPDTITLTTERAPLSSAPVGEVVSSAGKPIEK